MSHKWKYQKILPVSWLCQRAKFYDRRGKALLYLLLIPHYVTGNSRYLKYCKINMAHTVRKVRWTRRTCLSKCLAKQSSISGQTVRQDDKLFKCPAKKASNVPWSAIISPARNQIVRLSGEGLPIQTKIFRPKCLMRAKKLRILWHGIEGVENLKTGRKVLYTRHFPERKMLRIL